MTYTGASLQTAGRWLVEFLLATPTKIRHAFTTSFDITPLSSNSINRLSRRLQSREGRAACGSSETSISIKGLYQRPIKHSPAMQGFNMGRYVPPDVEGTTSANKLQNKHALGSRASKLSSQGVLTVRFEMPFAVWCGSCPQATIIGQGVRFNAAKKRVGSYHSTPIWSFRFRHADCGGQLEMQTDPKNTAYVVTEGGTKRDTGEDRPREGDHVILTDAERERLRADAFSSLEKTIADREQLQRASARIDELEGRSARDWADPYAQNQRLRKAFRAGRKERERAAGEVASLQDKMSLGLDILPETEADRRRAALAEFGAVDGDGDGDKRRALSKPLFAPGALHKQDAKGKPKAEKQAARQKNGFANKVMSNTRAARDPFLQGLHQEGTKRKRGPAKGEPPKRAKGDEEVAVEGEGKARGLVDYESD